MTERLIELEHMLHDWSDPDSSELTSDFARRLIAWFSEWQPIETAPKDGTVVDLWMVNQDGEGWREANAYFVKDRDETWTIYDGQGGRRSEYGKRDGWWAPNHDYDGQDGFCDQPVRQYGRPLRDTFERPTHWMPRPDPPAQG